MRMGLTLSLVVSRAKREPVSTTSKARAKLESSTNVLSNTATEK